MTESGVFITLYDYESMLLYRERGVFSFLMPPQGSEVKSQSRHYHALADYACVRGGTHVFFFLKREIYYGGQVIGPDDIGAFSINGPYSPLGEEANAPLVWDETPRYIPTVNPGIFIVPLLQTVTRCQPFLLRFDNTNPLTRKHITSDQLYFELGSFPFPLPTNAIQDMSFCTMTPAEVKTTLSLLEKDSGEDRLKSAIPDVYLSGEPTSFSRGLGIQNLAEGFTNRLFVNEAQLEFSVIANPYLLPELIRPRANDTFCRQVPISPFKPAQMDRADVCYYSGEDEFGGVIPYRIIELKKEFATQAAISQVIRYLDWLYKVVPDKADKVIVSLFAPAFKPRLELPRYRNQIQLVTPTQILHNMVKE